MHYDSIVRGESKSEIANQGRPPRILSPEEQEKSRISCRVCRPLYGLSFGWTDSREYQLAREVLDIAAAAVRPGITTDEIDEIVHTATIERNAYPSPLNYRGFPKSVCTFVFLYDISPKLHIV